MPRRPVAALAALWLAILIVIPSLTHACPMHDGVGPSAANQAADEHSAHGAHGAHGGHGSREDGADDEVPNDSSHACLCVGECSLTGPAAVGPNPPALLVTQAVEASAPGLPDYAYVAVARALLLPFANGPPARLTDAPGLPTSRFA